MIATEENFTKIKAVVFDAYGTLFDVYSIQVLAEEFYPGKGADIAVKWPDCDCAVFRGLKMSFY